MTSEAEARDAAAAGYARTTLHLSRRSLDQAGVDDLTPSDDWLRAYLREAGYDVRPGATIATLTRETGVTVSVLARRRRDP